MDGVIVCPIHQWKFDVKTGECIWPGKCEIATYPVKVDGDHIFVDINSPSRPIQHNPIRVYHTKAKRRAKAVITVANRIYVAPEFREAFEARFRNRARLVRWHARFHIKPGVASGQ